MFALKSLGRKRYARAVPSGSRVIGQRRGSEGSDDGANEQIQVDSTTAWGSDTLFQFKYYEGGRYALLTSSCKFLTSEGACIEWTPVGESSGSSMNSSSTGCGNMSVCIKSCSLLPPLQCLFTLEYHGGSIAFRDSHGRYLAAAGRASVLRTRSTNVSRDELFDFEAAPIQVAFRADFNNRFVSIKQGVDLSANQNDVTVTHETFELQYNTSSDTWNIQSQDGNYWSSGAVSAISVSSRDKKTAGHFKIKWNDDGTCSILSVDASGKEPSEPRWVCARKSGQLCLSANDPVGFYMMFMNRQVINLRPSNGSGFLGLKQLGQGKIDCGKTAPDSILVEYVNSETDHQEADIMSTFNCCLLRMPTNGKYLSVVDGNCVAADSVSPSGGQQFLLELRSGTTLAIRLLENASYLNLSKQSVLCINQCQPNEATEWEF
jgi:fascin 1/2